MILLRMKRKITYLILAAVAMIAASCDHKELLTECRSTLSVNVVFDWRNSSEARPESMALYLFPADGGTPLRYTFQNSTGGEITVPYGSYKALCMNNDNTDWARLKDVGHIETFEIHPTEVNGLSLADLRSANEPTDPSADTLMVNTPGRLWTDAGETLSLSQADSGVKTLTLYPADAGCRYTIDIYDIQGAESLNERQLFSTFSGLAGGFFPGQASASDEHVTMPLTMTVSDDGTQIHGEFLNFGESPDIIYKNELTLHYFLTDGTPMAYRFDVTDQAHNAPDPRNVHIVLRGLPIPEPIANGGGLKPVVDAWLVEHIDIKM